MPEIILDTGGVRPGDSPGATFPTADLATQTYCCPASPTFAAVVAEGLEPTPDDLELAYRAASSSATRADVAEDENVALRAYAELAARAFTTGDTFRVAYCLRRMRAAVRAGEDRRAELRTAAAR